MALRIDSPRAVISRRRLLTRLDALLAAQAADAARNQLLALLKESLAEGRAEVRRRFEGGASGPEAARALAYLMDQLVRFAHDVAADHVYPAANPTTAEQIAVVAVGGYGRGELAPFSDIDLLFLLPYKQTARVEQIVEYVLYLLWDLGLQVGHATRSVEECLRQARGDITVRTSLVETRWLWGDQHLFQTLRRRLRAELFAGTGPEYIEAKLAERDSRHDRLGDSRYVLEPNIKDGKGGLRDIHTLSWIAKYVYGVDTLEALVDRGVLGAEEAAVFARCETFLWTVRFHLHYLVNRPVDRLAFDIQSAIAERMGYTDHAGTSGVERFMKHYFLIAKEVGDLTRVFCAVLEAEQRRRPRLRLPGLGWRWRRNLHGFRYDGERLTVGDDQVFARDPVAMLRLFRVAQLEKAEIHPHALVLVRKNLRRLTRAVRAEPEANRLFLEMLTHWPDPMPTLRRLNEAGVFGRFLPEFGRVVGQMQYDMYHVYTVDEHTIFALGILARIERGELKGELPISSHVIKTIQARTVLYVAVLLHDIAKGRKGDHSVMGAKVARKLCPRLGLNDQDTELVAWLVRHHLLMSDTAFKRDLADPKTIQDFIATVQSLERLRLLLVLTVADIRAVGPAVWNGWKATLLRQLFSAAEIRMGGAEDQPTPGQRVREVQAELRALLPDWSDADFGTHIARGTVPYWLSFDPETLARHARMVRQAESAVMPVVMDTRIDTELGGTEVTIYTADHPGVFSELAGAIALAGATVLSAQIVTMGNGMALDTFLIQDVTGGPFDRPDRLARLAVLVDQSLSGHLDVDGDLHRPAPIPSRTRVFKVPPRVFVDNAASDLHTVLEVTARDRPGLLYDITRALYEQKVQIHSAKISTYGEEAVDVFYIKDRGGLKIHNPHLLQRLRDRLPARLTAGAAREAAD